MRYVEARLDGFRYGFNNKWSGEMITKLPGYKNAIDKFDFDYGAEISHKWFFEAFGIPMPDNKTFHKDGKKAQLEFMANFKKLEEYLLEEKQIALKSIRGQGWQVVVPAEQTEWSVEEGAKEMKKALKKMYHRQLNVNDALLTADQKRENSDALAKTSMLHGMIKKFQRGKLQSLE